MIRTENAACFTGHRVISKELLYTMPHMLNSCIRKQINDGFADFITGGALGFDTYAAQEIIKLRAEFPQIRLILALPCPEQADKWNKSQIALYKKIIVNADVVYYVSEKYDSGCMMRRNKFMVDNSQRCIFYIERNSGGTYKTVEYAMEQNKKLYNIMEEKSLIGNGL